jgi:hypothetical protein
MDRTATLDRGDAYAYPRSMPAYTIDPHAALARLNQLGRGHVAGVTYTAILDSTNQRPLGASPGTSQSDILTALSTATSCSDGTGRTINGKTPTELSPFQGKVWLVNGQILVALGDGSPSIMVYGIAD